MGLTTALGWPGGGAAGLRRVVTVVRSDPSSGKLVRRVLVMPKAGQMKTSEVAPGGRAAVPEGWEETVRAIADRHALPPQLLHSVIKVESNYNPLAVSSRGALGLMQLVPATARRFGVINVWNPVENLEGGAKYLRYLLDLYHGDYPLALAAYNAGEQAVAKYGGVPPFPETQKYLVQVRKQMGAMTPEPGAPVPPEPASSEPARIVEIHEPDGTVRYVSQ
jgi:soluble lytic murein transglycosylase-like protein